VNNFIRQLRDATDDEYKAAGAVPPTDEEFDAKMTAMLPLIREHGLWEAIPEAAGNAIGLADVVIHFATCSAPLVHAEPIVDFVRRVRCDRMGVSSSHVIELRYRVVALCNRLCHRRIV